MGEGWSDFGLLESNFSVYSPKIIGFVSMNTERRGDIWQGLIAE